MPQSLAGFNLAYYLIYRFIGFLILKTTNLLSEGTLALFIIDKSKKECGASKVRHLAAPACLDDRTVATV